MPFAPTPRDIGEDGQDGNLVIVVPENARIVPKEQLAKHQDKRPRAERSDEMAAPAQN